MVDTDNTTYDGQRTPDNAIEYGISSPQVSLIMTLSLLKILSLS